MKVYRMENEEKLGPYAADWELKFPLQFAHADEDHPGPRTDGAELAQAYDADDYRKLKYAFASLEALFEWFEGWTDALLEAGFYVAEYFVPDEHIIRGDHQVAYDQGMAVA
jgi:hypothetical protein